MEKKKKKTLTISSDLKKKIDTQSISTSGKKSFTFSKSFLSKNDHNGLTIHFCVDRSWSLFSNLLLINK